MMENIHINEERLQALALDKSAPSAQERGHLIVCNACANTLAEYQVLGQGLHKAMEPTLSPLFMDAVMSRLPEAKPEKRFGWIWIPGFVAASLALLVGTGLMFPEAPGLGTVGNMARATWEGLQASGTGGGETSVVWLTAVGALAGFWIVDRILRKNETKAGH